MEFEKEMTAPVVSVGADTEQSSQNLTDNSLTDFDPDFKGSDDDLYREIQRRMAPDYLETVSMATLYDTDFEGQEPLIDGLLYRGAYGCGWKLHSGQRIKRKLDQCRNRS